MDDRNVTQLIYNYNLYGYCLKSATSQDDTRRHFEKFQNSDFFRKKEAFDKYDIFTVGETPDVTPEHGAMYTHSANGVVNMLFQFELITIDQEVSIIHYVF